MHKERCEILEHKKVAPGHYVLKLRSPKISKALRPGQFVQLLCTEDSFDPLLPRPFSFLTAGKTDFSLLYNIVGKGTRLLAGKAKGEFLPILGPLGNGFSLQSRQLSAGSLEQIALVGGGVGIPPLYHLAEHYARFLSKKKRKNIHVFLGARNKKFLLCEKSFKQLGVSVKVATDDGSKGAKGLVTKIFEKFLKPVYASKAHVYTCGPTPMLKAVSELCEKYHTACEASVEVPMACGFGACIGCAINVKDANAASGHRYAMACVEGPVFPADQIVWD